MVDVLSRDIVMNRFVWAQSHLHLEMLSLRITGGYIASKITFMFVNLQKLKNELFSTVEVI